MGKGIHRSIQHYISKLNKPNHNPTTTGWLLTGCRHPKTPSFAAAHSAATDRAATFADIDRFLFENFNSLYTLDDDRRRDSHRQDRGSSDHSPDYDDRTAPNVKASHRFFVSPGTTSGSLLEEARGSPSSSSGASTEAAVPDDSVAVTTFSKDPYEDFRRSMQEMLDTRSGAGEPAGSLDWEFAEDLLFCYLELNDRSVHKYILGAFADLMVSLRRRRRGSGAEEIVGR